VASTKEAKCSKWPLAILYIYVKKTVQFIETLYKGDIVDR